jgi:hypothetical protein
VRLVRFLPHQSHNFGQAGRLGFIESSKTTHSIYADTKRCKACGYPAVIQSPPATPVHNAHLNYNHSDAHDAMDHAAYIWVPLLLNLDPEGYRDFLELCMGAWKLQESGRRSEVKAVMKELRTTVFNWSQGLPLQEYVAQELSCWTESRYPPSAVRDLSTLAIVSLVETVARANERRTDGLPVFVDDRAAEATDPRVALAIAVRTVMESR